MTGRARALAIASATVGTGLLAGAFIVMVRAEASSWARLAWGVVALVAVATFLARFRVDRVAEALGLAGAIALGQTVALHAVLLGLGGHFLALPAVLRHLFVFLGLDALTLVTATLAGHWFPHHPPTR